MLFETGVSRRAMDTRHSSVMIKIRRTAATALAAALMVTVTAAADRPVHLIEVTASRFAFDPATIQVTAGEPVRLVIRSSDGVHGFSIPKLKIDVAVPKSGAPVTVDFPAPAEGRYEISCSEFCGTGHGKMKAALVSSGPRQTTR
jgi:cytochrome c oxidase subunit II